MMLSVALDEKFDVRCSILNGYDRGWSTEVDYIPRRLVLSLFASVTYIPDNCLTSSPFQFQRELQGRFWSGTFCVH